MSRLLFTTAAGGLGLLALPAAAAPSPLVTGADASAPPHVKRFTGTPPAETASFLAYGGAFTGGVRVASGDVTGDGLPDIITGAGAGGFSHVKVFSGATLAEVHSFFAYGPSFTGGVFVAAGDVTGDRRADLVAGADWGSPAHVKVFDGSSLAEVRSFFAYPVAFTGGVRVAAGDLNGDGRAELIAGTGPGAGQVKAFDALTLAEVRSFLPYGPAYTNGVFVAAGDVNGDGTADVVTGTGVGAHGHVQVFDGLTLAVLHSFLPFGLSGAESLAGVRVGAGDVNGDGYADILAATAPGFGEFPRVTEVRAFDGRTGTQIASLFPYGPSYIGGAFVAGEAPVPEPSLAAPLALAATLLRRKRK